MIDNDDHDMREWVNVSSGTGSPGLSRTNSTEPFYGSLESVWDNPGEPVPEETFTQSHL